MIGKFVHSLRRLPFPWGIRLSYKNATFLVCSLKIVIAVLLFQSIFGSSSWTSALRQKNWVHATEAEAMGRSTVPFQLIKRIKEICTQANTELETPVEGAGKKQSAASDLSKRLKDFQASNDANSKKALEEWRKRKMDRIRQREINRAASTVT